MGKAPARIATKAMAATLLLVVAAQPVDATPGSTPAWSVGLGDCQPSTTELDDITFVAEQEGMPLEEALARYGWQTCFVEVTNYLRETYPNEYAGAAITNDGLGAWIAFKGTAPAEVSGLVEPIPVSVEVIGGRGFSESELSDALHAAYYPILEHDEVATANGGYDIETGVITIQVQPRERPEDESARDRLRQLLQPSRHHNPNIHMNVVVVDQLGGIADSSAVGEITAIGLVAATILGLSWSLLRHARRRSSLTDDHATVSH